MKDIDNTWMKDFAHRLGDVTVVLKMLWQGGVVSKCSKIVDKIKYAGGVGSSSCEK